MRSDKTKAINWDRVTAIAMIIQTVAVVVSLLIIPFQLRQQNKMARAANIQKLAEDSSSLDLQLAQSAELTKLWLSDQSGQIPADDLEKERLAHLIIFQMDFYENMFYQCEQGLLDDDMSKAWDADMINFAQRHAYLKEYWEGNKALYHEAFRNHVQAIIGNPKTASPQPCTHK